MDRTPFLFQTECNPPGKSRESEESPGPGQGTISCQEVILWSPKSSGKLTIFGTVRLSFPFFAKKLLARLPPFFNNLLLFMNNPSRLPPGIYFSWKPLEQVCFPLGRDLENIGLGEPRSNHCRPWHSWGCGYRSHISFRDEVPGAKGDNGRNACNGCGQGSRLRKSVRGNF